MKKSLEEKYSELERLYKDALERKIAILKSARFSIITTDVTGIITEFNEEAERILGYRPEDVIGQTSPAIFHEPAEVVATAKALSEEVGEEVPIGFETFVYKANKGTFDERQWTYIHKNGHRTQVRLNVTALHNHEGQIYGYMGIAKDITKELHDSQVIQNQQAQLVSSAKLASLGEMAAGIAHEINNPLGIISGRANVLLQMIKSNRVITTEKIQETMAKIIEQSFRASKIIKSMRSLSRNSENDPLMPVSINEVIEECLELCRQRFVYQSIEIKTDVQSSLYVLGKPTEIAQILTNLLNNAHDAIESTQPQPDKKWVRLTAQEIDGTIEIAVEDSGPGIPQNIREKIMQPFFTTKDIGKGTGLGLSISLRIAQLHQGSLTLDDQQRPTRFILRIPAQNSPSKVA
jgi:PAS domain S-box-containing protein